MSVHRRKFLSGTVGTAAGLAACSDRGQDPVISPDRTSGGPVIPDNRFPVFSAEEYAERLVRVRHEMAERGIDLLYVTQPSNIYFGTFTCESERSGTEFKAPHPAAFCDPAAQITCRLLY